MLCDEEDASAFRAFGSATHDGALAEILVFLFTLMAAVAVAGYLWPVAGYLWRAAVTQAGDPAHSHYYADGMATQAPGEDNIAGPMDASVARSFERIERERARRNAEPLAEEEENCERHLPPSQRESARRRERAPVRRESLT